MGNTDGGGRKGGWRGEGRESIAWTITNSVGNVANPHNCMDMRDGVGNNIPIGWVAPILHQEFLPFSPNPLGTLRQVRQLLLPEWAESLPPRTAITSKICQTTEHNRRKRTWRSEEVVARLNQSILGKQWTTWSLEKDGSSTEYPSRYIKSSPLPSS